MCQTMDAVHHSSRHVWVASLADDYRNACVIRNTVDTKLQQSVQRFQAVMQPGQLLLNETAVDGDDAFPCDSLGLPVGCLQAACHVADPCYMR